VTNEVLIGALSAPEVADSSRDPVGITATSHLPSEMLDAAPGSLGATAICIQLALRPDLGWLNVLATDDGELTHGSHPPSARSRSSSPWSRWVSDRS
jgi:hypothetical protein